MKENGETLNAASYRVNFTEIQYLESVAQYDMIYHDTIYRLVLVYFYKIMASNTLHLLCQIQLHTHTPRF